MTARFSVRLYAALAALIVTGLARASDTERWYRVLIGDAPAGWMRASEREADGKITSQGEISFKLRRGPIDLAIAMTSEFVETADGKPLTMTLHQQFGATPVDSSFEFTSEGINVETRQAGQVLKSTRALPAGEWLCPAAGARHVRDRLAKGDKTITVSTLDPMSGAELITMTQRVVGPQTLTIRGRTVETTKIKVETSQAPGVVSTEYLDASWMSVRSDTVMGGITMSMVEAGPEVKTETGEAPELMLSTFVKPDRPIESPRKTSSATYLLTVPAGEMPGLPQTGSQRVEPGTPASAKLSVDTQSLAAAPPEDGTNVAFLASTSSANIEDPRVKALATRALKEAPEDRSERAETLRRFVYRFINKKGLDVGMATASEIARERKGDCSEHGVLLAALLRADGIPSRVAIGLLYVDEFAGATGVFGYHMWSQALLEKDGVRRWVDLDATLPNSTPFDATHITLGVSDLSDSSGMESMTALLNVIGNLEIKVESVK